MGYLKTQCRTLHCSHSKLVSFHTPHFVQRTHVLYSCGLLPDEGMITEKCPPVNLTGPGSVDGLSCDAYPLGEKLLLSWLESKSEIKESTSTALDLQCQKGVDQTKIKLIEKHFLILFGGFSNTGVRCGHLLGKIYPISIVTEDSIWLLDHISVLLSLCLVDNICTWFLSFHTKVSKPLVVAWKSVSPFFQGHIQIVGHIFPTNHPDKPFWLHLFSVNGEAEMAEGSRTHYLYERYTLWCV